MLRVSAGVRFFLARGVMLFGVQVKVIPTSRFRDFAYSSSKPVHPERSEAA